MHRRCMLAAGEFVESYKLETNLSEEFPTLYCKYFFRYFPV